MIVLEYNGPNSLLLIAQGSGPILIILQFSLFTNVPGLLMKWLLINYFTDLKGIFTSVLNWGQVLFWLFCQKVFSASGKYFSLFKYSTHNRKGCAGFSPSLLTNCWDIFTGMTARNLHFPLFYLFLFILYIYFLSEKKMNMQLTESNINGMINMKTEEDKTESIFFILLLFLFPFFLHFRILKFLSMTLFTDYCCGRKIYLRNEVGSLITWGYSTNYFMLIDILMYIFEAKINIHKPWIKLYSATGTIPQLYIQYVSPKLPGFTESYMDPI